VRGAAPLPPPFFPPPAVPPGYEPVHRFAPGTPSALGAGANAGACLMGC